ncbi:MAG: 4Fe-4S dicluster domain-containing protein, partial [Haloarculaceae archaeon]
MSDSTGPAGGGADHSSGGSAPGVPETGATDPTEADLDATAVFEEGEDFDLRPGADSCYKCSACDVSCPVAEVDDDFPGPKFQGPEQWRLKQNEEDYGVDESVMDCSNCMRCDDACPSGVPLSQMHNTARGQYVDGQMSRLSREY